MPYFGQDFDAGSRNDVIGFTEVPLRGVLQGGRLAASLSVWQEPARKKYSKLIPAGSVKGRTLTLPLPTPATRAQPLTLALTPTLTPTPTLTLTPTPTRPRARLTTSCYRRASAAHRR